MCSPIWTVTPGKCTVTVQNNNVRKQHRAHIRHKVAGKERNSHERDIFQDPDEQMPNHRRAAT